ncbi:MAG: sugar phosphate isomerase/epimerase family protein [Chlamydiota bacterium]|nr:sugar phosphate isomerase/epimerase [Candidatus Atribacteria bacterium]
MKISILSSAYILRHTLEESIEKASEAGYDAIDFFASYPHAEPRVIDKKSREKLRILADQHGLAINQIASYGNPTTGFFAEMEGYVTAQIERLEFAKDVGAHHVELVPGFTRPDLPKELTWKWAVEGHKRIAEYGEKIGIPIAIEFEPVQPNQEMWGRPMPPNVYDLKSLKRFIDDVGGNCQANLDIGHCNIVAKGHPESVKDDLLALRGCIIGVHCNDNDGISDLNLVPGRGTCDFSYYINLLNEMGYDRYVGIELEGEDNPIPAARESIKLIKDIMVKINAYK